MSAMVLAHSRPDSPRGTARSYRVLVPTGHLGFTPIEASSFQAGVQREPDAVVADSGSSGIGPHALGADVATSPRTWQEHDLELMFAAARRLNVPMIVGSASDTGTDRGVREFADIVRDLARRHKGRPFRLAAIYSEVDLDALRQRLRAGAWTAGLEGRDPLTPADLDRTERAVAVMGAEPIQEALRRGADVIIAGRACDSAIFAAPLLEAGYPRDIAFYAGKLMACGSLCAEPFGGNESLLGVVEPDAVTLEPMSDDQRCTPASVAAHAMYERTDPFREYLPGGYIDMSRCAYEAADERRTRATGSRWVPAPRYTVKLEGAGKVGERALMIIGIRDPDTIRQVDEAIEWSRAQTARRFPGPEYRVYYHVYGRNGVMGDLEPIKEIRSHELCVVVEGVAPTRELALEMTNLAGRNFIHARLPGQRGGAATAAFLSDEVLPARAAYRWTLNHVIEVEDPLELFHIEIEDVPGR